MEHKFKANINCESCVKMVSSFLDENESIANWTVDTENENKTLLS